MRFLPNETPVRPPFRHFFYKVHESIQLEEFRLPLRMFDLYVSDQNPLDHSFIALSVFLMTSCI